MHYKHEWSSCFIQSLLVPTTLDNSTYPPQWILYQICFIKVFKIIARRLLELSIQCIAQNKSCITYELDKKFKIK